MRFLQYKTDIKPNRETEKRNRKNLNLSSCFLLEEIDVESANIRTKCTRNLLDISSGAAISRGRSTANTTGLTEELPR